MLYCIHWPQSNFLSCVSLYQSTHPPYPQGTYYVHIGRWEVGTPKANKITDNLCEWDSDNRGEGVQKSDNFAEVIRACPLFRIDIWCARYVAWVNAFHVKTHELMLKRRQSICPYPLIVPLRIVTAGRKVNGRMLSQRQCNLFEYY